MNGLHRNHRCSALGEWSQPLHRVYPSKIPLRHIQPRMAELALKAVERDALSAGELREWLDAA